MVKHLLILSFSLILSSVANAQSRKNILSKIDTSAIRSSDIDTAKMRQMGANDDEIKKALKFKEEKEKKVTGGLDKVISTPNKEVKTLDQNKKDKDIEISLEDKNLIKSKKDFILSQPVTIYGQEFFRNNTVKWFEKSSDYKVSNNYILGIGDEILVTIWGFADLNQIYKIDETGSISPMLIGRIYLNGLTFDKAKSLIISKFGQSFDLKNSQIDVTVNFCKTINVNIIGEVNLPGTYRVPASNSAFNVLIEALGPNPLGSLRNISVKRNGEVVKNLDVYEYLNNPVSKLDFYLEENDIILVPVSQKIIEISGEIKRPFKYELKNNENLKSLISLSGGLKPTAFSKSISIIRYLKNNEKTVIDINYDSLLNINKDFELVDGDVVFIRQNSDGMKNQVIIKGSVKMPGVYELTNNMKVYDLINKAQGIDFESYMDRAYISRLTKDSTRILIPIKLQEIIENQNISDNINLTNNDILTIFSKTQFRGNYFVEVYGAVRKPNKFPFGEGMTLNDLLFLAGGLRNEADNYNIEISRISNFEKIIDKPEPTRTIITKLKIPKKLSIEDTTLNYILRPYDQVFVRTTPDFDLQQNITIKGEVKYPGIYSLVSKNEKISDILNRAGGLTEWAFAEGTSFYRNDQNIGNIFIKLEDVIKDKQSVYNYVLKDQDIITIPKTIDFVSLSGEIDYPNISEIGKINSPFIKGKRAKYYINEFGNGFSQKAHKKRTYVIHANGAVSKTTNICFINIYPRVRKGDVIVAVEKIKKEKKIKKEQEPFDWNKFIDNSTIKITGVLTLWLLLTQLNK